MHFTCLLLSVEMQYGFLFQTKCRKQYSVAIDCTTINDTMYFLNVAIDGQGR